MRKNILLIVGILMLVAGLIGIVFSCAPRPVPGYQYPRGPGMMGPGGVMGPGGMMGPGMMGGGGFYRAGGPRLSLDQAIKIVEDFLRDRNDPDLQVKEIMEFEFNFYAEFMEKSTGIGAFEALIDPYTGDIYPEPGPNMMWNTRYGMMSGMMWGTPSPSAPMTVTEEQALKYAQEFLKGYLPGGKADEVERFYGYYTIHVLKDNQIYGMLSVNGYTGQVWYHAWHGPFLRLKEFEH